MPGWRQDTARGYETNSPGNTSPAEEIVGYCDITGPASSGRGAGTRPGYAETEPSDARTRRRARVRAS